MDFTEDKFIDIINKLDPQNSKIKVVIDNSSVFHFILSFVTSITFLTLLINSIDTSTINILVHFY